MKDNIYWRMTKESWRRDRFSTVSFTAFVAISVAMISLTAMLFANLTGAIEYLMEVAGTPDFLQMHKSIQQNLMLFLKNANIQKNTINGLRE